MLLRFSVSNHLSIKDTQELSFIKSALNGPEEGLLSTPALPKEKVLPAAIIYGPNASGKSNLLDALNFMRHSVLASQHRRVVATRSINERYVLTMELRLSFIDRKAHV